MGTNYIPQNLNSGVDTTATLDQNFDDIQTSLSRMLNTYNDTGTGTNTMQSDFDMNSYDILNATNVNTNALYIGGTLATVTAFSGTPHKFKATIASMKAATDLVVGDIVQTLGYISAGDNGHGLYHIVAASTGSDDGGSYHDLTGISGQAALLMQGTIVIEQFGGISYSSKAGAIAGVDNATAIDNALATGKDVYFQDGYYGTTGNHNMATDTQQLIGSGRRSYSNDEGGTVLVRISGSNPMFQRNNAIGTNIQGFTLDGNDVNAVIVEDLVCFYSKMNDVEFKNCGSTSGALYLDRNNICEYRDLYFTTNITHLALVDNPSASNLNLDFYNITLAGIKNLYSGAGYGIDIESGVNLNFYSLKTDDYAPIRVAPASGYAVDHVNFYGMQFENDNDGTATSNYIDFDNNAGSGIRNIHFDNVRFLRAHASNTQNLFRFRNCQNVSIKGMHAEDKVQSACNVIELDNTDQYSFENIFYINTNLGGATTIDIIDAVTSASNFGSVKNIVYSGGSLTGAIKLFGAHIRISTSNCVFSWNGASSDVFADGLTTSIDGTNLTNWSQGIDGYIQTEQAVLASGAADGHLLVATVVGPPSGTPNTYTGKVQMVYDTTNNDLYVYNGSWKKTTTFS